MPTKTRRLATRITEETAAQIEGLARIWGPVVPLSSSGVVTEAIAQAWRRATAGSNVVAVPVPKKSGKKSD